MKVHAILRLGLMAALSATVRAWDFTDELDSSSKANASGSDDSANDEQRIYGGTEADASLYKYIVSLRKTADGSTYCGGSLIAPQYVITAAHCVKTTAMYASIGSKYSTGVLEGERIAVAEAHVHPQYNKADHLYDLAILKLSAPSAMKTVPLCNADGSDNKEQTMAVVRGWGMTETGVPASTLQEVNVRIITNAACNKQYDNRITDGMICAGEGGGKDSCQGDSGGPLVSNNKLIGLVSWGGACGEAAGVYVRLSTVLDWVNEKISGAASNATSSGSGNATITTPTVATVVPTPVPATTSPSVPPVTDAATTAPAATTAAPAATPAPAVTTAAPAASASGSATAGSSSAGASVTTSAPSAATESSTTPVATTATPAATTAAPAAASGTTAPASASSSSDSSGVTTTAPAATTATPVSTKAASAATAAAATTAPATGKKPGKKTTCMINKKDTAAKSKSNDVTQSYSENKELDSDSESDENEKTGNEADDESGEHDYDNEEEEETNDSE
ncbi:Serine protease family s01a [Globisporangium polare]